jgi:hypothetical protein
LRSGKVMLGQVSLGQLTYYLQFLDFSELQAVLHEHQPEP